MGFGDGRIRGEDNERGWWRGLRNRLWKAILELEIGIR